MGGGSIREENKVDDARGAGYREEKQPSLD